MTTLTTLTTRLVVGHAALDAVIVTSTCSVQMMMSDEAAQIMERKNEAPGAAIMTLSHR